MRSRQKPDAAADILEHRLDDPELLWTQLGAGPLGSILSLCVRLEEKVPARSPELFRKLYNLASPSLGTQHLLSLTAQLHFASASLAQDQIDKAERVATDLLKKCERLGGQEQFVLQCGLLLLGVYVKKGDMASGAMLIQRIPDLKQELLKFYSQ